MILIKISFQKVLQIFPSTHGVALGAGAVGNHQLAYEEMVLAGRVKRGDEINICVPTGNFGHILAAYYAFRCGLPVSKLICASNINKVLTDFIRTGIYDRRREFVKTESPSMDILISSNLERLVFELAGRNPGQVSEWMNQLVTDGVYRIPCTTLDQLQSLLYGGYAGQNETSRTIRHAFEKQGYLFDPHSAVGFHVLQRYREETGDSRPVALASTASPFKFNRGVADRPESWGTSQNRRIIPPSVRGGRGDSRGL